MFTQKEKITNKELTKYIIFINNCSKYEIKRFFYIPYDKRQVLCGETSHAGFDCLNIQILPEFLNY